MWMRLEATTRSPPSSSILVTAPVRLRRVASGLMIEKVRVTAIGEFLREWGFVRAPSRGRSNSQGSGSFDPARAFLFPEVPFDVLALAEHAPGAACGVERAVVEE